MRTVDEIVADIVSCADEMDGGKLAERYAKELHDTAIASVRVQFSERKMFSPRDLDAQTKPLLNEIERLRAALGSRGVQPSDLQVALADISGVLTRGEWLVSHVDRGHGVTKREEFDECSCGATFWRTLPGNDASKTPMISLAAAENTNDSSRTNPGELTPPAAALVERAKPEEEYHSGCNACGGQDGAHESGCSYVRRLEVLFYENYPRISGPSSGDDSSGAFRVVAAPPCMLCGGPHPFDTSLPSVRWNAVIRTNHYPEYLCLTCIVKAFALANESFTAQLFGGFFHGMPIEVRVNGQAAIDAIPLNEENNQLRCKVRELEAAVADRASAPAPLEQAIEQLIVDFTKESERWRQEAAAIKRRNWPAGDFHKGASSALAGAAEQLKAALRAVPSRREPEKP